MNITQPTGFWSSYQFHTHSQKVATPTALQKLGMPGLVLVAKIVQSLCMDINIQIDLYILS